MCYFIHVDASNARIYLLPLPLSNSYCDIPDTIRFCSFSLCEHSYPVLSPAGTICWNNVEIKFLTTSQPNFNYISTLFQRQMPAGSFPLTVSVYTEQSVLDCNLDRALDLKKLSHIVMIWIILIQIMWITMSGPSNNTGTMNTHVTRFVILNNEFLCIWVHLIWIAIWTIQIWIAIQIILLRVNEVSDSMSHAFQQ